MTREEISQLVFMAMSNFPHTAKIDLESTAKLWSLALNDIDYITAEKGLVKVLCNSKFFPTVSDIRNACMPDSSNMAELAWSKARNAISDVGSWNAIAFEDRTIHLVIKAIGGWVLFCSLTDKQLVWAKKEFVEYYKIYSDNPEQAQMYLTGSGDFDENKLHRISCEYLPDSNNQLEFKANEKSSNAVLKMVFDKEKLDANTLMVGGVK